MRLKFRLFFWLSIICFAAVVGLSGWSLFQLKSGIELRQEAYALQSQLDDVLEALQEADIAFVIYQGSDDERAYQRFLALIKKSNLEVKKLLRLSTPTHRAHQLISELTKLIKDKSEFATESAENGSGTFPKVLNDLSVADDLVMTEAVRKKIDEIEQLLTANLVSQQAFVDRYFNVTMAMSGVLVLFALFLFGTFARLVSQEIRRRTELETDLRRAQQAAISASQMKSQFLATVSHEVRTPLNGIIGMSELMKDQAKGELKKFASIIHDSGRTLLRIVNEILDFSKIEAGKIEMEMQEVRLGHILETAGELFAAKASNKGLLLLVSYPRDFDAVFAADGGRISQIVHNLTGNAIKFTSKGFVRIHGEVLERLTSEKVKIRISVQDSGVGIAPDRYGLLFHPFQQLEADPLREGTGLGLSISKQLVEKMGGVISFSSKAGEGSRFWMDLTLSVLRAADPVSTDSPSESDVVIYESGLSAVSREFLERYASIVGARPPIAKWPEDLRSPQWLILPASSADSVQNEGWKARTVLIAEASSTAPSGFQVLRNPVSFRQLSLILAGQDGREHLIAEPEALPSAKARLGLLLLVEDNATNQILARAQLERLGYRIHVVSNGLEALESFQRVSYDLVLMDCRMPEMDGFEATRRIRQLEKANGLDRTPIVAMTANALDEDRTKCLAAGMDDFVSKPFDIRQLHEAISNWIKDEKPQIDWSVIDGLVQKTSRDVVKRLIDSYKMTMSSLLPQIESAVGAGQWAAVSAQVHQLKSSSAALGAINLASICESVERTVEGGQAPSAQESHQLLAVARTVKEEFEVQSRF